MSGCDCLPYFSNPPPSFCKRPAGFCKPLPGWCLLGLLGLLIAVCLGCGKSSPFKLAPVSGRVTYADGSPIQAVQVRIAFFPQDVEPVGNIQPPMAQGFLDAEGNFTELTSYRPGDGAVIGRHKVTVVALDALGQPTAAVARRYHNPQHTPLEVTVVRGRNRFDDLKVERER